MVFNIGVLIVITTLPDENRAVKITESLLQQKWVYERPTNWSLPLTAGKRAVEKNLPKSH